MLQRPTLPGGLADAARHAVIPYGVTATGWPAVREKCRDALGVEFDPWQDGTGQVILSKRADGSYACSIGGVVISIPRQVGKTFLIAAIVFALCLLNPGMKVLWTAHHTVTATETFQSLYGFSLRKKVRPHVAKRLVDAMTIEFRNGSRIMFGARERGFGRGMTSVGMLVFDEAQILTEKASADMVPTTSTVSNALVIYTGTPPKPSDPSELFTNRRSEALAGDSDDMAYIEFSADADAKADDRKQWSKANPSYPTRTNDAAMLRMQKNMTADNFLREALGIWDEQVLAAQVLDVSGWDDLAVGVAPEGTASFGVKFSADGEWVALGGAVKAGSAVHVEGIEHRRVVDGTTWLVEFFAVRWQSCGAIIVDGRSGAGALKKALMRGGVPDHRVTVPTVDKVITAHAEFAQAIIGRTVTHGGDPALDVAVRSAGRRSIGTAGGWGFQSLNGEPVTLLEAVTLAHHGASSSRPEGRSSGREGWML